MTNLIVNVLLLFVGIQGVAFSVMNPDNFYGSIVGGICIGIYQARMNDR